MFRVLSVPDPKLHVGTALEERYTRYPKGKRAYRYNVMRSLGVVTFLHTLLGLMLKKAFNGRVFKNWPLYTYYHSLIHTSIVLPSFMVYLAFTVKEPRKWLREEMGHQGDELGAEQWIQTTNIGFQLAITLLSLKKTLGDRALMAHHIITIGGCLTWLKREVVSPYGAIFTAGTEFGSTFHNIMSLTDTTASRWLRVVTDIVSRPGGLIVLFIATAKSRQRGLKPILQFWCCFGGVSWASINLMWTQQVLTGLLKRRKQLA